MMKSASNYGKGLRGGLRVRKITLSPTERDIKVPSKFKKFPQKICVEKQETSKKPFKTRCKRWKNFENRKEFSDYIKNKIMFKI